MPDTDTQTTEQTPEDDKSKGEGTDWSEFTKALEADGLKPGQVAERLAASRRWEERAKANQEQLEALKKSQMSDTEKAIEEAKAAGRAEAHGEVGQRLAAAEIKAALAGVVEDPASIVEDLNLAKYVTDKGDVDTEAVKALAEKFQKLSPGKGSADLKQGTRGKAAGGEQDDGEKWFRSL